MCTYHNPGSRVTCEICEARRPVDPQVVTQPTPPAVTVSPTASPSPSNERTAKPPTPARSPNASPSPSASSPSSSSSASPSSSSKLSRDDKTYIRKHQPSIAFLTERGFSITTALEALRLSNGDKENALDYLAQHPPTYAAQSPARGGDSGPMIQISSLKRERERGAGGSGPAHLSLPPTATSGVGSSGGKKAKATGGVSPAGSSTPGSAGSTPSSAALSRSVPSSTPTFASSPTTATPKTTTATASATTAEEKSRREQSRKKDEERKKDDERRKREQVERLRQQEEQAAKQRAEERERLLAELKTQEDELKRKEKEARLAEVEEVKKRRDEDERKRKMAIIQKAKAEEEERRAAEVERHQHKTQKLATFSSLPEAIAAFAAQYDTDRVHASYRLLVRVLGAVLERPNEDKVRQLRESSESVQRLLVRPVFGLWLLKWLGWEEVDRNGETVLVLAKEKVDVQQTKQVIETLNKELAGIITPIPDFFSTLLSSQQQPISQSLTASNATPPAASNELLYYLALELRNTFLNVVTSPEERNFRSIDLHSPTYDTLFAPFTPALLDVLTWFGYVKDKSGVYLVVDQPNVRRFEAAVIELDRVMAALKSRTPIAITLPAVLDANAGRGKRVKALVEQLQSMMDRVLTDPFEHKYHRVKLQPLWQRCGGDVIDGQRLLTVCGFDVADGVDGAGGVAVLSEPVNAEVVRLRRREVERVWKEQVDRRRREKEEAERAADRVRGGSVAQGSDRRPKARRDETMEEDEKGEAMDVDG